MTSPLYHPLLFGDVVAAPDRVGAVLSTLTPVTEAGALALSAKSVAVPLAAWLAPSPSTLSAVLEATPESASLPANETVTSLLYQPLMFAARSAAAVAGGGVLSSLTVTESVALLPALSAAVPPTRIPFVSVVMALVA